MDAAAMKSVTFLALAGIAAWGACVSPEQCVDGVDDARCGEILGAPAACRASVCVHESPASNDASVEPSQPSYDAADEAEHPISADCQWRLDPELVLESDGTIRFPGDGGGRLQDGSVGLHDGDSGIARARATLEPPRSVGRWFVRAVLAPGTSIAFKIGKLSFGCAAGKGTGECALENAAGDASIAFATNSSLAFLADLEARRLDVQVQGVATDGGFQIPATGELQLQLEIEPSRKMPIEVADPSPPSGYLGWCREKPTAL